MIVTDSRIWLKKENAALAAERILKETCEGLFPSVNTELLKNAPTMDDIFERFGIDLYGIKQESGDYDGAAFINETDSVDELEMKLNCIAPFVETGSYIEGTADGMYCRYLFFDGRAVFQIPETITWKTMELEAGRFEKRERVKKKYEKPSIVFFHR